MKMIHLAAMALLFGLASASTVFATEGGGGAYPNGAEGFNAAALPPPGTYFLNYLTYYNADSFKGTPAPPGFKLDAVANVFRVVHMTKTKILGGDYGMQILVPVVNMDVKITGRSQSKAGLGDIIINPAILAFHSKNLHYAFGLDIFAPSGGYNKNDLANISRNYWTFEPIAGFTYISDDGYEVSSKFMYDFNTKNSATNYQSGQEFHFDYTVAKKVDAFSFGAGGYYYKQVTGDSGSGATAGSYKGRVFAVGPQIKYDYKNMNFQLKYQKEMLVEHRPEGDKFWFNFLYAF